MSNKKSPRATFFIVNREAGGMVIRIFLGRTVGICSRSPKFRSRLCSGI